jgi:hypothetical protein
MGGAAGAVTAGSGGSALGGAGGTIDPPSDPRRDCTLTVEDHSTSCPDPCPIETDVSIDCAGPHDTLFGLRGFQVAAADDVTLLATTGETQAWVAEVGRDSFEPRSLPSEWFEGDIEMELSPSGALYVAGSSRRGVRFAGAGGPEFETELVLAPDAVAPKTVDFDVDGDGIAHLWTALGWNGVTADGYLRATRGTAAEWELEELGAADGARFGLATDGAPVSYSVLTDGRGTIRTVHAGRTIDVPGARIAYVPVHNQPGDAGPPYAVVVQDEGELRAAWPDAASFVVDALPETPLLVSSCDYAPREYPCALESCHDGSEGVVAGIYAADRAPDGALWVAYVYRRLDVDITYFSFIDPENPSQRHCDVRRPRDETTNELHVMRVPRGEPPTTEIVLPMSGGYVVRRIEIDVRDAAVAVGVGLDHEIRVLRVKI